MSAAVALIGSKAVTKSTSIPRALSKAVATIVNEPPVPSISTIWTSLVGAVAVPLARVPVVAVGRRAGLRDRAGAEHRRRISDSLTMPSSATFVPVRAPRKRTM